MHQIKIVDDWDEWNTFLKKLDYNTFLHSQGWFEFNQRYGHKIWKYGLYGDLGNLVSICLVIKIEAKRGSFLFVPHGPWSISDQALNLEKWRDFLIEKTKENNCNFFRISPILIKNSDSEKLFSELGFRPSPTHMHAELTTVVDLSLDKKKILSGMRKTARQMIKKAEKMNAGGVIEVVYPATITQEMHQVYESTSKRGRFVPFSKNYLQQEYESFAKYGEGKLIAIKYQGKILSWGMFIFDRNRAFYHQGANLLHKTVPASYYCHWLGMQEAKAKGCISYDFWGVAPQESPNHPWATISSFKRGFGGQDVALVHAQDYPVKLGYWLTWAIETFRAKKRGF